MAQITMPRIAQIKSILSGSIFTSAGFLDEYPTDGGISLTKITFLGQAGYVLKIEQNSNNSNRPFSVAFTPGSTYQSERVPCEDFDDCAKQVSVWCKNIQNNLKAQRVATFGIDAAEFAKWFEKEYSKSIPQPEGFFTTPDIDDLKVKLRELETRFSALMEKFDNAEERNVQLHKLVEQLTSDAESLNRGTWFRAAAGKIWDLVSSVVGATETRQILADSARKLLDLDPK